MQVACRGGWPPGVDGSTRPLQWMCLLVVMMGGGGKAVSRTLLGCEIPSLRADRPPDLRTGSPDLLLLCWHLVQPSCVHLEMVPMPGSAVISPSAVADARLAGRSGWVQAAVPSGDR